MTDEEVSRILKNATGCDDSTQFKLRLTGNLPLIDTNISDLYITIHNGFSKYISIFFVMNTHDSDYFGTMMRNIYPEDKRIEHDFFILEEKFRYRGNGILIYQSNEELWRSSGYQRIELVAGKESGGYVWAINGYDYNNSQGLHTRNLHIQYIIEQLEELERGKKIETSTKDALVYAARQLVYPWQVAAFKIPGRLAKLHIDNEDLKIGKKALLKHNWPGYKELSDKWHGNVVSNETRKIKFRL
ncbi:hypothetical protein [Deinococcus sp. 6GRE01]|uniref:hypothetical protein n=1 Tax=Deinococcus sp. 6GRE01 TaxID=2745873 RepID=UPI001E5A1EC0|nr:hypothetical protein [Deinococcus sp. 6GRE01]MCD0156335.1 hypothetical protein [Deinococcus sp. 6GRE01]